MIKYKATLSVLLLLLAVAVRGETVLLKSGERVEGEITRSSKTWIIVRTEDGRYSTFDKSRLDPEWMIEHEELFAPHPSMEDGTGGPLALVKAFVGKEPLAKATPFLIEHRHMVVGTSAALAAIGLALCFFGWKIFRFFTVAGGVFAGILLGLVLASALSNALLGVLPESFALVGLLLAVFVIVIPFVIMGAKFGRRFAMIGARSDSLEGLGSGVMASFFSLTRFALFDLSVIWGHGLIGALLVFLGAYCGAVPMLQPSDVLLPWICGGSAAMALSLCIFGAIAQVRHLRAEVKPQGAY